MTLGPDLIEVRPDLRLDFADPHADVALRHAAFRIPSGGFVIAPGRFYLGHTAEVCGSRVYACTLHAPAWPSSADTWIHRPSDAAERSACKVQA